MFIKDSKLYSHAVDLYFILTQFVRLMLQFVMYFLQFDLLRCVSVATNKPVTSPPPLLSTLMYSLVPIMAVTAIVLFSFWMYRHHKLAYPPVLVPTQVRHTQRQWWCPVPGLFEYCHLSLSLSLSLSDCVNCLSLNLPARLSHNDRGKRIKLRFLPDPLRLLFYHEITFAS